MGPLISRDWAEGSHIYKGVRLGQVELGCSITSCSNIMGVWVERRLAFSNMKDGIWKASSLPALKSCVLFSRAYF